MDLEIDPMDMETRNKGLSIIIPIGPGDQSYKSLLRMMSQELSKMDFSRMERPEIILVGTEQDEETIGDDVKRCGLEFETVTICEQKGRARQMNRGAREATKSHVWFLHCDSSLHPQGIKALAEQLNLYPEDFHYFALAFFPRRPAFMIFNEWGVKIRSRLLKLPFGDQGFCLSKRNFFRVGGFDEAAPFGEDHLFVWKIKEHGLPLRNVPVPLYTSSRKYRERGWMRTTLRHLYLTAYQAWPFWINWVKRRLCKSKQGQPDNSRAKAK